MNARSTLWAGSLSIFSVYILLYMYSEVRPIRSPYFLLKDPAQSAWIQEQERRRSVLRRACGKSNSKETTVHSYKNLVEVNRPEMNHLLVDDKHRVIYCFLPKVGCTNWKKVFMILSGISNVTQINDIDNSSPHLLIGNMQLITSSNEDEPIAHKLANYTKFIVVRHPFERLISAYFDKIHHKGGIPSMQQKVLPFVRKEIRSNATLSDITWPEFVSFVVRRGGRLDDHWMPYETLCFPCRVDYDYILKFETLDEDSEELLRAIGAPDHIHFPRRKPKTNTSLIEQLQNDLTPEQKIGIFHYFANDYYMFDYSIPV
ncbi:carbohydrate sulfotransferase 8-like [Palaemon carinicauda]|uniref:carbohydrate sulfotransferase 8-like n=1 Tax=Palaemon carinicauda TaxID=392227 RepID=UPI0035B6145B